MGVLQERILMIDHIVVVSWYMQLLQKLLSVWIKTIILLSTKPIIIGLINIIIISPWKTSTLPVCYSFNKILKFFFVIRNWSTWFRVNLILHPLYFLIQQLSHIKLSNLLVEIKLVLIYWIINILKYLMSLIQSQIHQAVINLWYRLRKFVGRCYQCRRFHSISSITWWNPEP